MASCLCLPAVTVEKNEMTTLADIFECASHHCLGRTDIRCCIILHLKVHHKIFQVENAMMLNQNNLCIHDPCNFASSSSSLCWVVSSQALPLELLKDCISFCCPHLRSSAPGSLPRVSLDFHSSQQLPPIRTQALTPPGSGKASYIKNTGMKWRCILHHSPLHNHLFIG